MGSYFSSAYMLASLPKLAGYLSLFPLSAVLPLSSNSLLSILVFPSFFQVQAWMCRTCRPCSLFW